MCGEPYYVEIGELGLVPDAQPGNSDAKALWGVDDIQKEVERLRSLSVVVDGDIQDVGGGIRVVDIADPFGNLIGLIENRILPSLKSNEALKLRQSR